MWHLHRRWAAAQEEAEVTEVSPPLPPGHLSRPTGDPRGPLPPCQWRQLWAKAFPAALGAACHLRFSSAARPGTGRPWWLSARPQH